MDNKCTYKFPCKRDFWYIVIIAGIINIGMLVNYCYHNEGFVSKVEFASTLASIILSVIAIVLTLTESSKNSRANEQILESSDTINKSTIEMNSSIKELRNLNYKLSNLNIVNELSALKESLKVVDEKVCCVDERVLNFSTTFASISDYLDNGKGTNHNVSLETSAGEIIRNLILAEKSFDEVKETCYLLYRISQITTLNKSYVSYLIKLAKNKAKKNNSKEELNAGFYGGISSCLVSIGIIQIENNKIVFNINVDEIFHEFESANADIVDIVEMVINAIDTTE